MKSILSAVTVVTLAGCASTTPQITGQAPIRNEQYQAAYTKCLSDNLATETEEFAFCLRRQGVYYSPQPTQSTGIKPTPVYTPSYSSPATYSATHSSPSPRSTYRHYITGPRGGCYYINGNGNKTYVDRSMCR